MTDHPATVTPRYSYLLECLHIADTFEANASRVYCLRCGRYRNAACLTDTRIRSVCQTCRYVRYWPDQMTAAGGGYRHLNNHPDHTVNLVDSSGRVMRVMGRVQQEFIYGGEF